MGYPGNQTHKPLTLSRVSRARLEIIQKQRTTAPTKGGLLAIDDTGCPKPFAKKTEGAKRQYCGPLKREEACNVGAGAAFASQAKHFPIDIRPLVCLEKVNTSNI